MTDPAVRAIPRERTLDATLGFETIEAGPELMRGRIEVADRLKQPFGLVHGGVYASLCEALCTRGTTLEVGELGMVAAGLATQTSFMRPIVSGGVNAVARRRHRGRTTWVWEAEVTDADGRLCVLCRVTVAVRPPAS